MSTQQTAEDTRSRKPNGRQQEEKAKRRRRSDMSIGRLSVLDVANKDPDYAYRWINDEDGRVHQLTQLDDWDIVTADQVGTSEKDRGVGQNVERVVDRSTGKKAVLVRKLKEYYDDDKAKAQALIDETDKAIKRGQTTSPEGLQGPHAYVPEGGIHIQDGRKG